jgi:hypothetical protein
MAINKVIYGGNILLDLTGDTVTADQLKSGVTAHDKSGEVITGTCTHDVDSTDATVTEAEILSGKTAYARGAKVTGKMTNNGGVRKIISTKNSEIIIPHGFHDGSGSVTIASEEKLKLVPSNIRGGVTILGVEGTMSGMENVKAQSKTVAPSTSQQQIVPDEGYNYLSEVTVGAIPYEETGNAAGGITVTIA